jgi:hypothetical protein
MVMISVYLFSAGSESITALVVKRMIRFRDTYLAI